MATNNAINLNGTGLAKYDGAGTFSAVTVTQFCPLLGAASNGITSIGPLTNGQLAIGSTGADANPSALSAGTGITITNGAGSIQIDATGSGMAWSVKTLATNMAVNNGYGSNAGGAVAFTLPAVAAVGSVTAIVGMQGTWNIVQGAGQQIYIGSTASTLGAGGSISSTNAFDSIELLCLVANTFFYARSVIGNLTVV